MFPTSIARYSTLSMIDGSDENAWALHLIHQGNLSNSGRAPISKESIKQATPLVEKSVHPTGASRPQLPKTFNDLPAEIRSMIWEAALVPRVIVLKPRKETSESDMQPLVDYSIIPGILYANWESRSIALKHYDQNLALTFTEWAPVEDDSAVRTTSRIPIIMAACDEIAFSSSQIGAVFAPHEVVSISIDTAPGAPEPCIRRFSLLSDKLTSHGIDTEHLARLLDPESFEYDCSESADIFVTQTIDWVPFNQWHEIGLSDEYPEGMDTLCVHFELAHSSLDGWLSSRFNSWCRGATYFMDRDGIDASVLELPDPVPPYSGRL